MMRDSMSGAMFGSVKGQMSTRNTMVIKNSAEQYIAHVEAKLMSMRHKYRLLNNVEHVGNMEFDVTCSCKKISGMIFKRGFLILKCTFRHCNIQRTPHI